MYNTHFRDKRTGTVYVCREKQYPTTGQIPLKPAYKEDTVWIDRSHLDKVPDPHKQTTAQGIGALSVILAWVIVGGINVHYMTGRGLDLWSAAVLETIAVVFGSGWSIRLLGLVHS